jgi:hypothetical protein
MALSQKYLERVRRLSQEKDKPKTVSRQQMTRLDAAIKQQRIERERGGCRSAAKWLEKNFPHDFGEAKAPPRAEPSCETRSSINCPNSEPVNEPATVETQPLANAPESPQSAPAALPALSPIPLAKTFCGLGNYPSHKSPADQRAKFEKRERIGSSCKTYKSFSRPAIF